MAAKRHEDAFPPPRLSGRSRFSQGTFAGTRGNGEDAPLPAVRAATIGRLKSTQTGHDRLGLFNYLVGAGEDRRRDYEFTAQPKLVVKI